MKHLCPRPVLALRLAAALFAAALFLLPAEDAHADISVELKGMFGLGSATHDQTASVDDPLFDIGGGGLIGALFDLGGLLVGLDFRYWYEGHTTTAVGGSGSGGTFGYHVPAAGVRVRFDFMPQITAGIWLNYAFGSASIENNQNVPGNTLEWAIQGFDGGLDATYNYKLDPYKTYILFGLFAHYQYLRMIAETDSTPNMISNNIAGGVNLGVRFDFGL